MPIRTRSAVLLGTLLFAAAMAAGTPPSGIAAVPQRAPADRLTQQPTADRLVFTRPPTAVVVGRRLGPPPVTVMAVDARGRRVPSYARRVTLHATNALGTVADRVLKGATAVAVKGVARFPGLAINRTGQDYRLTATDGRISSAPSAKFNVVQQLITCPPAQVCTATVYGGGTWTTLQIGPFVATVTMGLAVGGFPRLTCQRAADPVTSFRVSDTTKPKQLTYLVEQSVADNPDAVCYGAPARFPTLAGTRLRQANGEFEGLLPPCPPTDRPGPCVLTRSDLGSYTQFQLFLPPGPTDPRVAY